MDWLRQYETTLQNTLQSGDLKSARALTEGFHRTGTPPLASTCYLESVLHYYEGHYPLALFWADKGFLLDPSYAPLQEILRLLTEYPGDFSSYTPSFFQDLSYANRPLRILIVEGSMSIVNYTAEQFRMVFEALGHEVFLFFSEKIDENPAPFWAFCQKGVDFCLTFNNLSLSRMTKDKGFLWDFLEIPCFDYMFDHPLYFFDTFDDPPACAVVTCVDRRHVDYIRRFYPSVKNAFFLPLGGEEIDETVLLPWEERPIQALYVGNLKQNPFAARDDFSQKVMALLKENTKLTVEEAIEQLIEPDNDTDLKWYLEKYRYCDLNTNSYYREHLIRVLVQAGIHVTVYGEGWESCDFSQSPFFHLFSPVSQKDCILQMQNSRFVLNSMPWFKDGTHDRVYNAMLARSLCITDPSGYLSEEYEDHKDILYYCLEEMEKLPQLIRHYEANPEEAAVIIENGYQKTVLRHTWQNRALELLERFFTPNYR